MQLTDESLAELEQAERDREKLDAALRAAGLPEALIKATCDPFDYAMGLRDGTIFRFESASYEPTSPEWVYIEFQWSGKEKTHRNFQKPDGAPAYTFDRGVYVRLSDIQWVADAPQGS